jgi:hypothetical protein
MKRKLKGFISMLDRMRGSNVIEPRPPQRLDEKDVSTLLMDLLLEALRVGNEEMNALAAELIVRCGDSPVRRLVLMAADPTNRPQYRVRILNVIRRIGIASNPDLFFDLSRLATDKHAEVRYAAVQLIATLREPIGTR